MFAQLFPGTES